MRLCTPLRGCRSALVLCWALPGLAALTVPPAAAEDPARATEPGVYLVTLAAAPVAEYDGGDHGLQATRPRTGARLDRTRPAVQAYVSHLLARQDALLHRVGDPHVLYHYTTALDGFAAALSSPQVRSLRGTSDVLRVERSTRQHLDAVPSTTSRLTPSAAAAAAGVPRAGRVVVGVVDSGLWPENPSFQGVDDPTPGSSSRLPGFHGSCAAAQDWRPEDCTEKVVSARWFVRGFGAEVAGAEYLSPRDGSGHGSHVASVAAGDRGVRARIGGQRFGTVEGTAPAARIAVYKACWRAPDPDADGCTTADTVAAVDAAVADGVDVLTYAVSGDAGTDDTVEKALLGAASAGVFVAVSAGNSGAVGSVAHPSPWVTTVGASARRTFLGTVRLGDGRSLTGAMVSDRRVHAGLVLGSAIRRRGASVAAARQCLLGSLSPAGAQGRIVVCDRGGGPRVDKSASVAASGGVAMVLADVSGHSTQADVHAVPTVHLDTAAAAAVKAYVRSAGGAARATLRTRTVEGVAPVAAGFSGRGPASAFDGDVLKPDLVAPGVSVLGAVAPPSDAGRSWDLASGTSVSAASVAGLAASVLAAHPAWSPAEVKSALMTTARDLPGSPGPFTQGAGSPAARRAIDPGLVLDTDPHAWQRVARGRLAASEVNGPSVSVGNLVGPTTLRRRLTNVTTTTESYAVRKRGLRGVDVQAFPATIRLAPGQSRTVRLRISARPSATGHDVTGWLVWRGSRHVVRVPVAVHPTVVSAPASADGAGRRGQVTVTGRSGNGRTVPLRATGLVPARDGRLPAHGLVVRVPRGTLVARFAVQGQRLTVRRGSRVVGRAAGEVTLTRPRAGRYLVVVRQPQPGTRVSSWLVPRRGGSALSTSTDAVGMRPGRFTYDLSWTGLRRGPTYLGMVAYAGSDRHTVLEVVTRRR